MITFSTQLLINLGLASIFMFLTDSFTLSGFVFGFILGTVFLFAFLVRSMKHLYLYRIWKIIVLISVFTRELIVACFSVLKSVFLPISRLNPGIIAMPVDFDTAFELVLFCNMVTLTPGTLTLDVAPDNKTIYIHVLDCSDEAAVIAHIQKEFVDRIKEVKAYA